MYFAVILLAIYLVIVSNFSYTGYKIYRIEPKSTQDVNKVMAFDDIKSIEFLTPPNKILKPLNILIAPIIEDKFVKYLKKQKLSFHLLVEDVQKNIEEEQKNRSFTKLKRSENRFDHFLNYHEILDYLGKMQEKYPKLVSIETIGKSYEGRNVTLVVISSDKRPKTKKIFIDAGVHAREWIAPALALYIIHQLVAYPFNQYLIKYVDWIILPLVNPDGYEFSFTKNRFWRKTRSKGEQCDGVDGNRNFDFQWMKAGASSDECSEVYAGLTAFSEKEIIALSSYLLNTQNVSLYLSLHSCGKFLLYPWGWTSNLSPDWAKLDRLGRRVAKAIKNVRGTEYVVGSVANIFYPASGASDDWAYAKAKIRLSYTIELPCGRPSVFILPPEEILPIVQETWEGIKVFHDHVVNSANKVYSIINLLY